MTGTKRKLGSVTSDTNSHNAKSAKLAVNEQCRSSNMVRNNSSRCLIRAHLMQNDQESNITFKAPVQRSVAFEKLDQRMRSENEAQARYKDQNFMIPGVLQRQTQDEQMRLKRQIQEIDKHIAERLPPLAITAELRQDIAERQILQNRLDRINKDIEEGFYLADNEADLTSSSDDDSSICTDEEADQIDTEIGLYEYPDQAVVYSEDPMKSLAYSSEESDDESEWEGEEGDEGYYSGKS